MRFLRQAGRFAGAPRPGLILLDLHLPGRHGLEILAEIKADPGLMTIPVAVLSISASIEHIQRIHALHADAYIAKPADFSGLCDMIRQIENLVPALTKHPA